MHVSTAGAAADVQPLQECFELGFVCLGNADEEQNAAAMARAALREEEQSLMAAALLQVIVEDGFPVRNPAAHRADADNFRYR